MLAVYQTAGAGIVHVPVDQTTIAAGIAAASPGDTVLIACDTYHEYDMIITKNITIASDSGDPSCVTIDADGLGLILFIEQTDSVTLEGITFKGGLAEYGASVVFFGVDAVVRNCVFRENHATGECAGLKCKWDTVQVTDCLFVDNTADSGTAGCELDDVDGIFQDCTFEGNEAAWGAGISIYRPSTVTMERCHFENNHAVGQESFGAGAYCYSEAAPTFTECTFTQNYSDFCGGGLVMDSGCAAVVQDCDFTGNTAVHGGAFYVYLCGAGGFDGCTFVSNVADTTGGGGLLDEGGGVQVTHCAFLRNEAYFGGGLSFYHTTGGPVDCTFFENSAFMGGAVAYADCVAGWATGCTMVRNEVEGYMAAGAGVAVGGPFDVALERCIIAFSTAGEAAAAVFGTVTAIECDVFGNLGGDWVGALAGQETGDDNTGENPLICDAPAGDLTLCADSPCLPGNNVPGVQIGAHGEGCESCGSAVEMTTWGALKALFR